MTLPSRSRREKADLQKPCQLLLFMSITECPPVEFRNQLFVYKIILVWHKKSTNSQILATAFDCSLVEIKAPFFIRIGEQAAVCLQSSLTTNIHDPKFDGTLCIFIINTHSRQSSRRRRPRNPFVHRTIWPCQCTWAWHWAHPWGRRTCCPDRWWQCSCFRRCHPCNLCSHRSATWREYNGGFRTWIAHCGTEGSLEKNSLITICDQNWAAFEVKKKDESSSFLSQFSASSARVPSSNWVLNTGKSFFLRSLLNEGLVSWLKCLCWK